MVINPSQQIVHFYSLDRLPSERFPCLPPQAALVSLQIVVAGSWITRPWGKRARDRTRLLYTVRPSLVPGRPPSLQICGLSNGGGVAQTPNIELAIYIAK